MGWVDAGHSSDTSQLGERIVSLTCDANDEVFKAGILPALVGELVFCVKQGLLHLQDCIFVLRFCIVFGGFQLGDTGVCHLKVAFEPGSAIAHLNILAEPRKSGFADLFEFGFEFENLT